MASSALVKALNYFAALFARIAARIFYAAQWDALRTRLTASKSAAEKLLPFDLGLIPTALVAGEDRRFFSHYGIDLYSITRALYRAATGKSIEGASTITQQLVRVYSGDYRYSISRKLKEIMLASLADDLLSKNDQIKLYLFRAYFGWKMNGINQATDRLGYVAPFSGKQAAEIIARLKYPEPHRPSQFQTLQIEARVNHILELMQDDGMPR